MGCHASLAHPGVDLCPCVFVVLPRSFPAPHPTCSLHSSPSAGPFPAHLSCFHGHRFILHSSSHPRYRKLLFCLFTDPLLPSPAGEALQEDGGPALGQGHPSQPRCPARLRSLCIRWMVCVGSAATISALRGGGTQQKWLRPRSLGCRMVLPALPGRLWQQPPL